MIRENERKTLLSHNPPVKGDHRVSSLLLQFPVTVEEPWQHGKDDCTQILITRTRACRKHSKERAPLLFLALSSCDGHYNAKGDLPTIKIGIFLAFLHRESMINHGSFILGSIRTATLRPGIEESNLTEPVVYFYSINKSQDDSHGKPLVTLDQMLPFWVRV